MNLRRLLPLTAVGCLAITATIDTRTVDRFTVEASATESTVNLTGIPAPDQQPIPGDCASWFGTAMRAGWTWDTWPTLVWIMGYRNGHGESGCVPTVTRLRGRDRSYGLLQLNTKGGLWDKPIAWGYPSLKDLCGLTVREELLDGFTNLRCGRLLFEVHEAVYGNGWKPW